MKIGDASNTASKQLYYTGWVQKCPFKYHSRIPCSFQGEPIFTRNSDGSMDETGKRVARSRVLVNHLNGLTPNIPTAIYNMEHDKINTHKVQRHLSPQVLSQEVENVIKEWEKAVVYRSENITELESARKIEVPNIAGQKIKDEKVDENFEADSKDFFDKVKQEEIQKQRALEEGRIKTARITEDELIKILGTSFRGSLEKKMRKDSENDYGIKDFYNAFNMVEDKRNFYISFFNAVRKFQNEVEVHKQKHKEKYEKRKAGILGKNLYQELLIIQKSFTSSSCNKIAEWVLDILSKKEGEKNNPIKITDAESSKDAGDNSKKHPRGDKTPPDMQTQKESKLPKVGNVIDLEEGWELTPQQKETQAIFFSEDFLNNFMKEIGISEQDAIKYKDKAFEVVHGELKQKEKDMQTDEVLGIVIYSDKEEWSKDFRNYLKDYMREVLGKHIREEKQKPYRDEVCSEEFVKGITKDADIEETTISLGFIKDKIQKGVESFKKGDELLYSREGVEGLSKALVKALKSQRGQKELSECYEKYLRSDDFIIAIVKDLKLDENLRSIEFIKSKVNRAIEDYAKNGGNPYEKQGLQDIKQMVSETLQSHEGVVEFYKNELNSDGFAISVMKEAKIQETPESLKFVKKRIKLKLDRFQENESMLYKKEGVNKFRALILKFLQSPQIQAELSKFLASNK